VKPDRDMYSFARTLLRLTDSVTSILKHQTA
jgi:hypothetical protein